ncbi:MAG TPA: RraA family protein [Candidatus Cybelea sp.]|nr:RraA family protein [Candidatus Cybelea sp.]
MNNAVLTAAELAELAKFDTPTICNALEIVAPERRAFGFNTQPLQCIYPEMPPMVGYARTANIRSVEPPKDPKKAQANRLAYFEYIAAGPKPAIVVHHDLDGAQAGFGCFWGEVMSHVHRGLGCVGLVTDGSIRDVDMNAKGFQMLARCVMPSHAWVHSVDFGGTVRVMGMTVSDGDLIHADRHGAVVIPLDAARKIAGACELLQKREAVILSAAKSPGFGIEQLRRALQTAAEIH